MRRHGQNHGGIGVSGFGSRFGWLMSHALTLSSGGLEVNRVCQRQASYGLLTARDAHNWFLDMMREHEEFEVETDRVGQLPMPFCSETVRRVMVE